LADKLNCDPMRITKKYAGASCLGRRVYHHRDRLSHQPPTVTEIHLARVELDLLESRFRSCAEGGDRNSPTGATTSTSSLLPVPTMSAVDVPNAGLAQTMALFLQNHQQQQSKMPVQNQFMPLSSQALSINHQQTAATNSAAAMMAAQQTMTQNQQASANPLQALLLSLAMAAGTGQPPQVAPSPLNLPPVALGNGIGLGAHNPPFSTMQGQLQQPPALPGWLSQLSQMPNSTANMAVTNPLGAASQVQQFSHPLNAPGTAIAPQHPTFFTPNTLATSNSAPTPQIFSQSNL
jgi:hypothetical protein